MSVDSSAGVRRFSFPSNFMQNLVYVRGWTKSPSQPADAQETLAWRAEEEARRLEEQVRHLEEAARCIEEEEKARRAEEAARAAVRVYVSEVPTLFAEGWWHLIAIRRGHPETHDPRKRKVATKRSVPLSVRVPSFHQEPLYVFPMLNVVRPGYSSE